MGPDHRRRTLLLIGGLLATTTGLVLGKVRALGYDLASTLPEVRHRVTFDLRFDGHDDEVQVRTFLPRTDVRQRITDEENKAGALHLSTSTVGLNRVATWSGGDVPDGARIEYSLSVYTKPLRFEVDPALPVPATYPAAVLPYLRPEKEIQVDHPEIQGALDALDARRGPALGRLRRIFERARALAPRSFKGTTDAVTALRLGEASCNGKSRLFVALARAAGIPARLVGGLVLGGGAKKTSHQWAEAYIAGHWVSFCPTNGYFAELPANYLSLYYGDETLFRHTADINFDYRFAAVAGLVPSARAKEAFGGWNIWAMFERVGLPFSLLRTVLMLPIGALVVVLFRNVVGMPTFGTFLPALIAAAAGETGVLWGLAGVLVIVLVVALVRRAMQSLGLLHSPTLAILLAGVTASMLLTSLVAERFGLVQMARLSVFPIAVLAITAERFYLTLTEQGVRPATKELAGTLVVIVACNLVMSSLALQILISGFPEILLAVVAADVYLGRWVGIRLFEYLRFRRLLFAGRPG